MIAETHFALHESRHARVGVDLRYMIAVLVLLICMPVVAFAQASSAPPATNTSTTSVEADIAPSPCFTFTSEDEIDLEPKTQLESIYYASTVCYRKRWQDSESKKKELILKLGARNPETLRAFATNNVDTETSNPLPLLGIGTAIGALIGGALVWFLKR